MTYQNWAEWAQIAGGIGTCIATAALVFVTWKLKESTDKQAASSRIQAEALRRSQIVEVLKSISAMASRLNRIQMVLWFYADKPQELKARCEQEHLELTTILAEFVHYAPMWTNGDPAAKGNVTEIRNVCITLGHHLLTMYAGSGQKQIVQATIKQFRSRLEDLAKNMEARLDAEQKT